MSYTEADLNLPIAIIIVSVTTVNRYYTYELRIKLYHIVLFFLGFFLQRCEQIFNLLNLYFVKTEDWFQIRGENWQLTGGNRQIPQQDSN